jgi:transposase-like protein
MLTRLRSSILHSMGAKGKKRSVLEDATALKEALNVHCEHLTREDRSRVAAKALLNSLINKNSSMEEIVKYVLPSPSKKTRRLGSTRRTHQR